MAPHMQPHMLMQSPDSSCEEGEGQGNVQNTSAPPPPHSTQQPSASTISTPHDVLGGSGFAAACEASCFATSGTAISRPCSNICNIRSNCSFLYFLGRPFLTPPDLGPHLRMQFRACEVVSCNRDGRGKRYLLRKLAGGYSRQATMSRANKLLFRGL